MKGLFVLGVIAVVVIVVAMNAPRLEARPDPAPVAVWNDSALPATVAVVGAVGQVAYAVPAHALATVAATDQIGEVKQLVVLGSGCRAEGGNTFGSGANSFTYGGQLLVRDGLFAGWTTRLAPEWAAAAQPSTTCPTTSR